MTEPVIDVPASGDVIVPGQDCFAPLPLASVICEEERRREHRRCLTIMLPELVVFGDKTVLAQERAL